MQNVQNNFTVENLVAKYHNYVAENCPKEYFCDEYQDESGKWQTSEGYMPCSPDCDAADEQLLVTLYKQVAGSNADDRVLTALSRYAERYYSAALTEEEFSFLCSNFEEAVAFSFSYLQEHKRRIEFEPVPLEIIDIIKKNAIVQKNGTVFVANAGGGDVASLFAKCKVKGYTSFNEHPSKEEWALTQIRLYSQGLSSDIHVSEESCTDASYLDDVDCIIWGTAFFSSYNEALAIYQAAKPGTQMILFLDDRDAAGKDGNTYDIRKAVVDDRAVKSVISFEYKDMWLNVNSMKIALLIEKKRHDVVHIKNGITGEDIEIPASSLDHELLWPGYYSTKRPGSGIPISKIVSCRRKPKSAKEMRARIHVFQDDNGEWVLPEAIKCMPVAIPSKMGSEYKDANLLAKDLDLAGNPVFDDWKSRIDPIKEKCVLLWGNKEKTLVGYINEIPPQGIATFSWGIIRLIPKKGIDVRYIAALLLSPEVKGQLESICQGYINDRTFPLVMNKVLVPKHSDKERVEFLSEANYEAMQTTQKELVQEHKNYTKAVRMRKHALSQSFSAMKSMFSVLNRKRIGQNGVLSDKDKISPFDDKTVQDAFDFLSERFESMGYRLDHIADVEYDFSDPEWIDPENFVEMYVEKNMQGWINFKPQFLWKKGRNLAIDDLKDSTGKVLIKKGEPLHKIFFSHDALERVINNIVSNAQAHGFTEEDRNDYVLRFSWHLDGSTLLIEIENNGTPIPSDRSTSTLLEYGVSTALSKDGHNGIGCNEIDNIMRKYDGSIRIVSNPNDTFKVKYILTFERTNSIETYCL